MRRKIAYRRMLMPAVAVIVLVLMAAGDTVQVGAAQAAKKSDAVVKINATAGEPGPDGKQVVTLTLKIDKPWHLYANPVPPEFPGIPTEVKVEKVKPEDVKVDYPPGKLVKDAVVGDYKVYEDQVTIKATVQRARGDRSPLELSVRVQACTDKQCLLPATVKLTVPSAK